MGYNIAIDGPAGAGKSTVAKKLAEKLGFVYIDTGAMYRAMGLFFEKNRIDLGQEPLVRETCRQADIAITYENGQQQIWLQGENVTARIRTEEAGKLASACAKVGCVREKLVELQKKLAREHNTVMDGRDIGTVVLPDAELKIYLTASVLTRAKRRYKELTDKGNSCSMEEIRKDIEKRDYEDTHREISPLRQAEDAELVDTSEMDIEEAAECLVSLYRKKRGR